MKDYYVKEVNSLERLYHVEAESKEEALEKVNEFIDNDINDFVIEEIEIYEPLEVTSFEENNDKVSEN